VTGEQVRWGMENLNIDERRQKELGVQNMFPTIKTSCDDHEGSGLTKVQRWDGKQWVAVTPNWVAGDRTMIRKMVEESSAKYAAEKKITPACLP
jgi:branched-chain amino acid transport system substrate-binding protein